MPGEYRFLTGSTWHTPADTHTIQQGTVTVRAQYIIEWEIKWLASNDPPSHTGSWMNFLHVGSSDSHRVPGLWLGSSRVDKFYVAFDEGTYGSLNGGAQELSTCCSGLSWTAGAEYDMAMEVSNSAGSGTSGCTGRLTVTPKATGVTYTATTQSMANCVSDRRGQEQAIYIGDPWYNIQQWSTRNVRVHYFE